MNLIGALIFAQVIAFAFTSVAGGAVAPVTDGNYNCAPFDYGGTFFGCGVTITGEACKKGDGEGPNWYVDINIKASLAGITVLSTNIHLDSDHQEICVGPSLGVVSAKLCLQSINYSIRLYGEVCTFGKCRSFGVTIFSWKLMRNYRDCSESFLKRHVWKDGNTATNYLDEFANSGEVVPSTIAVLTDTPKMSQYKCLIPNRPQAGFVSKDPVNMDVFLTQNVIGEDAFRCKSSTDKIRLCFDEFKQPYRLFYMGTDVVNTLRKDYVKDCTKLKAKTIVTVKNRGNITLAGTEDVSDKVLCPYFPSSCE